MIYQAPTLDEADYQLAKFAEKWTAAYPMLVRSWQQNWARVIPMFSFAPEIRRAIYTTNTIESLNMTLRKTIKNRAMFPSDEAVFKILYLALKNISKKWTMPLQGIFFFVNLLASANAEPTKYRNGRTPPLDRGRLGRIRRCATP